MDDNDYHDYDEAMDQEVANNRFDAVIDLPP
jgi:hypothetical protein